MSSSIFSQNSFQNMALFAEKDDNVPGTRGKLFTTLRHRKVVNLCLKKPRIYLQLFFKNIFEKIISNSAGREKKKM
jgi:hypothetical protein